MQREGDDSQRSIHTDEKRIKEGDEGREIQYLLLDSPPVVLYYLIHETGSSCVFCGKYSYRCCYQTHDFLIQVVADLDPFQDHTQQPE